MLRDEIRSRHQFPEQNSVSFSENAAVTYTIKPDDSSDYILIEVEGDMTRAVGKEVIVEAHRLARKLGIEKFFMDLTKAVNRDTTTEQFQFANSDMRESKEFNRFAKCAGLVAAHDHSHDFVETVIRNIGINFRLFRNRQQALDFIGYINDKMEQHG
ncbi:MAG: hypothetical protein P8045_11490 [Candidatus Thiodiazotropha sp.]